MKMKGIGPGADPPVMNLDMEWAKCGKGIGWSKEGGGGGAT